MDKKVLLISIPEIINSSLIQENVDQKVLSKTLALVQEVYLKPILGETIYNDFIDAVELKILSGTTLTPVFEGLLQVVKPYLVNRTVAEFIVVNNYKITQKGILKMNDTSANNLTEGDLQAVKDLYDNYSTSFKIDLITYLEESGLKPTCVTNEITSDATGWYLGIQTSSPNNIPCEIENTIDYSGITTSPLFYDKKILIISIPEIIKNSIIQENVDTKILSNTLSMVQEVYLRQILKPNLYNFLIDSIYRNITSGDTLSSGIVNLLQVVKPYLINKTVAEFIYVNQYKITNKGILSMNDTSANNVSEGDLQAIKDTYDNISTTYKINLIEFLECNNLVNATTEEIYSDSTGWYLDSTVNCGISNGCVAGNQLDFTGPVGPQGPQGIQGPIGPEGPIGPAGAGGAQGYYGVFYSLQDQTISTNNAVSAMTYSNTAESFGISIQNGSQIKVTQQGVYNIEFSAQLHHRSGGGSGEQIEIWFRKNGVNIPDSNTRLIVPNGIYTVASWNFMLSLNANDYVEIIWTTDNTNIALEYVNNSPNIPSVIATIMQVMYTQSGISGTAGSNGNSGISGLAGTIGVNGTSGISGLAGTNGTNGTSGISGLAGTNGTNGTSGISGLSGRSGISGRSGVSGISFDDGTPMQSYLTNLGTSFNDNVWKITTLSNGNILVGGQFTSVNGITRNRLVQLLPDGTVDTNFSTNLGSGFDNAVLNIVTQKDGKILVCGNFTSFNGNSSRQYIVRLNGDGTEDTTFNNNLGTTFQNFVYTIDLQSDGKILVGGDFLNLIRLNTNGTVDTAFSTNFGTINGPIRTLKVQSDDKIVIAGSFNTINGISRNQLTRLNSNGTVDTAFHTNLGTGPQGTSNVSIILNIQNDGKILFGGGFTGFNGNTNYKGLIRLNSNGTIDTPFMTNLGTGFNNEVYTIEFQNDGRIFVGGTFTTFNGNTRLRYVRFNSNGSEDSAFYNTYLPGGFAGAFATVYTTALNNYGELFVGGAFTTPSVRFYAMSLPSNIIGMSGISGLAGTIGVNGTSGISGLSGISGISGRDGNPFTGGTISAATRFTGGVTANTINVTTISATTYQNLPYFIKNVTRTGNPLYLNVTGSDNLTTSYPIIAVQTLTFPSTNVFDILNTDTTTGSTTVRAVTGGTYNQSTGVVTFGGTGSINNTITGFTTQADINNLGPKFNIPVPKIKLKVGASDVEYFDTTGQPKGTFIIRRIPQIITMDLSDELLQTYQVFIEMVHYARNRPKRIDTGSGIIKVPTRGGWVVEPSWLDSGNGPGTGWNVPWVQNFPVRGNTARHLPFNNNTPLPVERFNWINVATKNTKYDTTTLFHNKFIQCDINYVNSIGAPAIDSQRIVPCQNMKKHGRNKPSRLYPYSPWARPLHVAFRYIVWMPNANNGQGQIISGPLSSPVHVKFSRFPYQYLFNESQSNGVASCEVVSSSNEYTCFLDESLMKKIHRGYYYY